MVLQQTYFIYQIFIYWYIVKVTIIFCIEGRGEEEIIVLYVLCIKSRKLLIYNVYKERLLIALK
jgi:hypothetical protein